MKSLTHYLTENILTAFVIAMLAVLLFLRYVLLLGTRSSWQSLYTNAMNEHPNIAKLDFEYYVLYPNMPLDIRIYHVTQELKDVYIKTKTEQSHKEYKVMLNIVKKANNKL